MKAQPLTRVRRKSSFPVESKRETFQPISVQSWNEQSSHSLDEDHKGTDRNVFETHE